MHVNSIWWINVVGKPDLDLSVFMAGSDDPHSMKSCYDEVK